MSDRELSSADFYARLPPIGDFGALGRRENFASLPEDWHVIMSDVRGSTAAVERGRYKDVNTVSAAVITALLNAAGDLEIPFVFEGDGATLCVPPALLDAGRAALLKAREMASRAFGLDLRVATLPVRQIVADGYEIRVAKVAVSKHYAQAIFTGGGLAYAERLMKDSETAHRYAVSPGESVPHASFDGLECRWQDIPSPRGETVSLIVRALGVDRDATYRELLGRVRSIYGSEEDCHPVHPPNLTMTLSAAMLGNEAGVRASDRGRPGRWLYLMRARFWVLVGWVFMNFGIRTAKTDWSRYRQTLVRNADVRKFNDAYRQILAGTPSQRTALTAWLEERFAAGALVYGLHYTDRAHMTCLVFDYAGRHLHFIDGADGGLFFAAQALKRRVATARA